jgi:hypothetical protein
MDVRLSDAAGATEFRAPLTGCLGVLGPWFPGVSLEDSLHAPATDVQPFGLKQPCRRSFIDRAEIYRVRVPPVAPLRGFTGGDMPSLLWSGAESGAGVGGMVAHAATMAAGVHRRTAVRVLW